jgi:transposase-like protein
MRCSKCGCTLFSCNCIDGPQNELSDDAVKRPVEMSVSMPNCPKCARQMVGGAPHGPWRVQYECHSCGVYYVPAEH